MKNILSKIFLKVVATASAVCALFYFAPALVAAGICVFAVWLRIQFADWDV